MAIKIALINPPFDPENEYEGPERNIYPPLSLLALATFLRFREVDANIKILDGQIISLEGIIKAISEMSPQIVGISPFLSTYGNTLKIARWSKKIGAKVVLGGHHASSLAKEILLLRGPFSKDYCVDCIVQNDGEEAFYKLVMGEPFERISNLIFLSSPKVIQMNNIETLDFDRLPITDRDLIDVESYFKNQRALNIFSKIGCDWRGKSGGCIFCSRMHNEMRTKSPINFWRETILLREKYKVNAVFDGRDDFLDDDKWLQNVHKLSFDYFDKPKLTIFARPNAISASTVKMLKEINVSYIILGLESGDQTMLNTMRKGISPEINKKAVEILSKNKISIFGSLVLGAPQENIESLRQTLEFAKKTKQLFQKTNTACLMWASLLEPRPGSIAFDWILERLGEKYRGKDLWNRNELIRDWINNFCHVGYNEIRAIAEEINSLNKS